MAPSTPETPQTPETAGAPTTAGDEAGAKASASQTTPTVTAHEASRTTVATPQTAPAEVQATTLNPAQPILGQPARRRTSLTTAIIVVSIVLGIALLLVLAYFLFALGPGLTFIGAILALIPLAIVLLGVRWIDRWEPEPRLLLIFAFLWGATVSIIIALVTDLLVTEGNLWKLVAAGGGDTNLTVFLQSVVQAPIAEEFGKGLGILLIYLVARRYFDGPVDGIVFAALVGAGFAFTENIQYFALQLAESGRFDLAVGEVFFIRGILSPFAHVMFSAMTGFFIGLAARKGTAGLGILMFLLGLVPAILLHAFWNGVLFFIYDFYGYYLIVQVPLFIVAVIIVILLRRRETQMTQLRLGEYAAAGWLNASEVETLGTAAGRRRSLAWARSRGLGPVMKEYIKDATHLAFTRNRIVSGRDRIGSQADEALLLAQVTESRRALMAAQPVERKPAPTPPA